MSCYPKSDNHIRDKVKVVLDLYIFIIFLDSTKLKIVCKKIAAIFK